MADRADFELAFTLVLGHEGELSLDRQDRGNWTTGVIGQGELKGTKWGISAMSYPHLDIRNLSTQQAHDIYLPEFWEKVGCHEMSPRLAFVVFDAAINNGPARAIRWLQQTVGATQDGQWGPNTRAATERATARDETRVIVEVHSHRLRFMSELSTWNHNRGGWSRRLVKVPFEAAAYWPARGG